MLGITDVPQNYTDAAHAQFTFPATVNYADANLRTPYTMSFNVGVPAESRRRARWK